MGYIECLQMFCSTLPIDRLGQGFFRVSSLLTASFHSNGVIRVSSVSAESTEMPLGQNLARNSVMPLCLASGEGTDVFVLSIWYRDE